jgi:hypothetical protein
MTMDNLSRCAMAARIKGMSYGKYMALYGQTLPKKEEPIPKGWRKCLHCGKLFKPKPSQKYCEPYCREQAYAPKGKQIKKEYMKEYRERKKEEA